MVTPPGDARDETWILSRLASACGTPLFGSRVLQAIVDTGEMARRIPFIGKRLTPMPDRILGLILRAAKLGSIKAMTQAFPHGKRLLPNLGNNYLGQRVITKSGKVELAPQVLLDLANARLANSYDAALAALGDFKLITKRERYSHNSWAHNDPAFVKGKRHTNYLYMHPDDAKRLGLREGDSARVESDAGHVDVPVTLTTDMMPGSVALPHGWGHQSATTLSVASKTSGVNANILALDGPDAIEPRSGMAQFNGITVRIKALSTRTSSANAVDAAVA
jgi:anaerobic selenocysteine-containing dehydrogenase